jgi:uncharacterized protein
MATTSAHSCWARRSSRAATSDRKRAVLRVQGAFLEAGQDARRVTPELADELRDMQAWLGLHRIEVAERGDLAAPLLQSVGRDAAGEA